ncbi:MAG TPA: MFS transporter [Jiangellaceae bacterium]
MPQTTAVDLAPAMPRRLRPGVFAALAVLAVAVNLRAPITSVPPLVPAMKDELGLTGVTAGLITTLPVLCMGLLAPVGHRLGHRFGRERAVYLAVVLLLAGSLLRVAGGTGTLALVVLYSGTLLIGSGIAISGALLPSVVKHRYPARSGLMTGTYMGGMNLSASFGALLAVPLAVALGSWRLSLVLWAIPVVIGLAMWRPVVRSAPAPVPATRTARRALPWRHATAWLVVGYLLLQSTQFYTQAAWIPSTYEARGWSAASAGVLLTVFSAAGGVTGVILPILTDRVRDNRLLVAPCALATVIGLGGVVFAPDAAPWAWMALIGVGLGAGFGLGLVYLVDYSTDAGASARLTAMAFLFSYGLGSLGPVWFGALRDATGSFTPSWTILFALALVQLAYVVPLRPERRRVD